MRLKALQRPAWLINIYFLNDPIGPADRQTWEREIERVKASLGIPDKVIQLILRHSDVDMTLAYYVKFKGPDAAAAMEKLEQRLDEQTTAHEVQPFQDCEGTVRAGSGATPESVN